MDDLSRNEKLARLWFLIWEAPVVVLVLFVAALGNRTVFSDSDELTWVYTVAVTGLFLTSIAILLFQDEGRRVGIVGVLTVVVALVSGPPVFG